MLIVVTIVLLDDWEINLKGSKGKCLTNYELNFTESDRIFEKMKKESQRDSDH